MSVPGAGLLALLRRRNEPEAPQAGLLASQSSSGSGSGGGLNKYEARSSAVHALEHAVAAGSVGEAARPVAQGRHIPAGPEWTYNVDIQAPHEAQPQLPVNPITMINTDYALNHYRQIATNSAYICYGLKAGHIRVLSRASAVRALLKGHTAPLTDLAFAPPPAGEANEQHPRGGGELLASGGRDGQLYVWHLQVDDDAQAVNDTQQLRASFTSAAGPAGDVLLSWHKPSRRLLAVGAGGRVLLVTVPLGGGMEQLQFDLDEPSTPDATVLPDWSGEAVSCLAFSHDGQLLAAGGAEGTVRVWRLQQGSAAAAAAANGSSGGAAAAPTLVPVHSAALPVGGAGGSAGNGGAVGAVRWLPAGDGHGWVLLTGNGNNSVLQLWHSGAAESGWQLLQSLRFEGGGGGQADFFNHVEVVPGKDLVVLADTARKALYTLHTSGSGADLRFDYVARFGVTLPILSFTAQWNPAGGEQGDTPLVELGCVQTTAVQQYSLDPALCHAGGQQPGAAQQQAAISRPTSSSSLSKSEGRRHSSHSNHEWEFTIQPQPSGAVPLPSEALAGGGGTTPRAAAASEAAVAASPTAVAAAEAAAAPMAVAATDDNDSGLPAANGTAGVGAAPEAGEAADVAAEQVEPVAQQAEQEPEAEPSIEGVVPLSSIPRLQPPPEEPAQGPSGEASPEQCPSPPPTPVDHHPEGDLLPEELAAAADQAAPESPSATAAAATAAPARVGVVAPPPPHLLTPSDLLQSGGGSSVAASAASRSSAGSPSPQRPRHVLQRPSSAAAADAAAAAAGSKAAAEAAAAPAPAVPAALPAAAAAPPAAAALDDAAVAAAVAQQMGGVHKKFVGHVSLMYRELLKALKSELGVQAAAQQQATAQLLATALEAQKQQIEAERAAVLAEERLNIERLLTAISATLNQELPAKLAEAVRGEVAGVAAGVAAAVAPAVQQAVAATLSTELPGAVRGAGLDKTLAPAVAAGLGKPLQEAFRTAFSKQLLPAFESATQEVFQQVNTALAAGLQEHVQASKAALAEPSQLATQLAASLSSAQALAASLSQGQQQLLRAQSTGTVDSRSSPRSAADIRGELTALLRAGKYDAAFSRALGLQDVATVGWLAAQVDAGSVLAKEPCPLSQMVLLSLVQQLATDLTADVAARLTWIREAAMVINPADPVLARHLRPVLEGVHAALQAAAGRLQGAEASSCRLTMHVVHSQLTSC